MADTDFDGLPALGGAITQVTVIDNDNTPNKVIDAANNFKVTVKWNVSPAVVAVLLDGNWTIKVFAESVGPGPEKLIAQTTKPATGVVNYAETLTVLAGTLSGDVPPDSGVYKLTVVITYRTTLGVLTEMAGFSEGPNILLREP
jgi:hypothetical protein